MHVPEATRKKLDDKSETMILVGYHETSSYRLYNLVKNIIIVSRDVIMCESKILGLEE